MPLPTPLNRADILTHYRSRIAQGNRSKLSAAELESLIEEVVTRLAAAKTELEIRSLCDEELALLKEEDKTVEILKLNVILHTSS